MAGATSSSPVIASLLSLQHELKKKFDVVLGSFDTIIRLLELDKAATRTQRNAPAALAKRILDALLSSAHAAYTRGEPTAASALLDAFVASAEPVWSMMLAWLRNGPQASTSIGAVAGGVLGGTSPSLLGVDPEFFIEDNELPLLDSDFWNEGLVLRVEGGGYGEHEKVVVPQCMEGLANQVLGAGKAVALLRVLDPSALDGDGGAGVNTSALSLSLSASCEQLRALSSLKDLLASSTHTQDIFSTEDFLANVIHDNLVPYCRAMQAELVRVISTKCDLWYHFGAIEKLFLMRRGDIAGGFADTVFARVRDTFPIFFATDVVVQIDARLPWTDFHFLNISLQDTLLHPPQDWVGPTLVRLSYKRNTASLSTRSVEALAGIRLEYAVPYPLTYLLHPSAMQIYGDVWSLLLQLRRAKSVLERILVRGGQEEGESTSKVMWALRSRLAWFVK
jgi:gamma-tubulin complex component 5